MGEGLRLLREDRADVVIVLGSQNSSNSQRLRQLAADKGIKAYLIDGPQNLDLSKLEATNTVLMTAGASAPESVVQQTIDCLVEKFNATVELETIREESVRFPLPKLLRSFSAEQKS